jgi:3-oxoacyl-[acyl-carrier protein] reductase
MSAYRHALVTGAATGIGLATARHLLQAGCTVHLADRDASAVERAAAEMSGSGQAIAHVLDVTNVGQAQSLIERLPGLSVLVNNAGIFDVKDFFELAAADFERMYAVNTVPMFTLARLAAPRMAHGGRIINLASRAALGARHYAHYVASKSAVVGLTRAMALELAPLGITVNAVSPGVIETGMLKSRSDTNLDALRKLQPLGRLGTPDDVARTIAFLADPAADFITGQVILVDGGRSLGGIIA